MLLPRLKAKPARLIAVAENFDAFEAIADDLNIDIGDGEWSVASLAEAAKIFAGGAPATLEQALVCVDDPTPERIAAIAALLGQLRALSIPSILLVRDAGPSAMHALMRAGADDFLPYPPPEGELLQSLQRQRDRAAMGPEPVLSSAGRRGAILPVYAVSGGAGGTTLAVNLAWELALLGKKDNLKVCLLDLDFQYGSVSTYLDLPRQDTLMEVLSSAGPKGIEREALAAAFVSYQKRLSVMTAPIDTMPMDIVSHEEVEQILSHASAAFDFVVVDLPHTLTGWTETCIQKAETFFAVTQMDMRSAQNTLRFLRILKSEELPLEKLEFVMNHSPGFTDVTGRGRLKRMAESLGIEFAVMLPDGGRQVGQACDHGQPLEEFARGNAMRKEIRRLAQTMKDAAEQRRKAAL